MMKEFLSICIPTYNRAHLLQDLLDTLVREITTNEFTPDDVKVYVSDNASTDNTRELVTGLMNALPHLVYSPNPTNIGAGRNILGCHQKSNGHYRWIIGDDETLPVGALAPIIQSLRAHKPSWFINNFGDPRYTAAFNPPKTFASAGEFLHAAASSLPEALLLPGFISANIFREDCFDVELGMQHVDTGIYPQFFALLQGLHRQGGSVYFIGTQTLMVRPQRPTPSGKQLPTSSSDDSWSECMAWVKATFSMPKLDIHQHSKLVSRGILTDLLCHPIKTFLNYRVFFLMPKAYPKMLRRLYWLLRS